MATVPAMIPVRRRWSPQEIGSIPTKVKSGALRMAFYPIGTGRCAPVWMDIVKDADGARVIVRLVTDASINILRAIPGWMDTAPADQGKA